MADDDSLAVAYAPLAYLTPENQAAQKCLNLLGDRNSNLPNLVQHNHQLALSNCTAGAEYQYLFTIDNPGHGRDGSWILGKGEIRNTVDLQLCSSRSRQVSGPVLATISIHP